MDSSNLISGRAVAFRLKSAVSPAAAETVRLIGPELEVSGTVLFLSDGSGGENEFAIVEVDGICTPLIVPVACLDRGSCSAESSALEELKQPSRKAC